MKTKMLAMAFLAGSTMFAQVRFGIGVGVGPVQVAVGNYRSPSPGPGYFWVEGYTDEYGNFINGYWTLPPYQGAYWIGPSYYGGRFTAGYWGGERHVERDDFRRAQDFRRDARPQARQDFHNNARQDVRNNNSRDAHSFRR